MIRLGREHESLWELRSSTLRPTNMRTTTIVKRVSLALAVLTLTLIGPLLPANACSCVQPDAAEFLNNSEFVFVGSLVADPTAGGAANNLSQVPYTFSVDAVYKGDLRDPAVQVWSATNGAACGFELAVGEPVGIAAAFFDGRLSGGLCSVVDAEQLVAVAEQRGISPTIPDRTAPVVTGPADGTETAWGFAIGAVVVALAGAGWALASRRDVT